MTPSGGSTDRGFIEGSWIDFSLIPCYALLLRCRDSQERSRSLKGSTRPAKPSSTLPAGSINQRPGEECALDPGPATHKE